MKKVKELKKWIELYNEVHAAAEELQLAYDYVKEGIVSEEEVDEAYGNAIQLVESLEFRNMLRQEADQMSCVLKINSGAGHDAQFASYMLPTTMVFVPSKENFSCPCWSSFQFVSLHR